MKSFLKFLLACIIIAILIPIVLVVASVIGIGAAIVSLVSSITLTGLKWILFIAAVVFFIYMLVKFFNDL